MNSSHTVAAGDALHQSILAQLWAAEDEGYKAFTAKLIPGIKLENMIGVRIPVLRKMAKKLHKDEHIATYLNILPHAYHEEMCLHALILSEATDYDTCVRGLDAFLPHVDNWAVCDILSPRLFKKPVHASRLLADIQRWMSSPHPYTVRFGICCLMSHFLGDNFTPMHLQWVAQVQSEHYYVNMMRAWYFATALAKQWEATLPLLEQQTLDRWTHQKTIQKAIESYRLTEEQKAYLRTLRSA